jgi:16S rRNA (guanine527-N7)-methyltransferase
MTEDEAREWLEATLNVPRETLEGLSLFLTFLKSEAAVQNLIARSTMETVWARHVVDSAQLVRFAPGGGSWIDLGSGAGFPGLIVAAVSGFHVTLVEERRKRIDFLTAAAEILGVTPSVTIVGGRVESAPAGTFDVISARAFAPLDRLLTLAARFAGAQTTWLLPKGRSAQAELDAAAITWQGDFRLEPSVTDPASAILIARNVRPREQR